MGKNDIKAKDRKYYRPCGRCGELVHVELSQCRGCGKFNVATAYNAKEDGTILLRDMTEEKSQRIQTGPWDPVWGTTVEDDGSSYVGPTGSSVTLIGGAPGAGKSTLAIQLANSIAKTTKKEVLYVQKEEPDGQFRARYRRLKLDCWDLIRVIPINKEADLGDVLLHYKPVAVFIDSFKKVAPDPADQVTFASRLKQYCVDLASIGIIIDHVNKEQDFSGHMANQHEVDTTLLFTVWPDEVRELRTVKNRNGASGVRVLFDMCEQGLVYREDDEREDEEEEENENYEEEEDEDDVA